MAQFDSYAPRIRVNPTVSTTPAYTSGDVVGGLQTIVKPFNDSKTGVLKSVTVKDNANQQAALTIYLFDQAPTGTYTDNGAFSWGAGDFAKCIGFVTVAAADYVSSNSKAIAEEDVGKVVQDSTTANTQGADTKLYAIAVTTSTPTYAATTDLEFQYGFLQS